ncbi:MAG: OmpH family outer membrane protein [Hymenobacter sp.]|nr:MAG: OmpH family outer membrane protein [Hymenobacter sp.]
MKQFLCAFAFLGLLTSVPARAQRLGYIDTEFIMSKMPEYAQAQVELNRVSDTWQKELEALKKDLDKMYRNYQNEEVVLTEPMKKKRQDEILKKEQEIKAYQTKQFGYEGQLFKKRAELNKPAQDKIFEAVEKMVKTKKLDIVLDKASDLTMIYTNPTYDYTEYVLEELGLASPDRNQPAPKGKVKTVEPPKTPATAARSVDSRFATDSGTPTDAPATIPAAEKQALPKKP